jgi:naphthalene 1,2-dioxygenase system ferredoxin subunit
MFDTEEWIEVARSSDVREGVPFAVEVTGTPVALYRIEGQLYATSDICTHEEARLTEGFLEGCNIECPLHAACFDVTTGEAFGPFTDIDLKTYPVRQEQDRVFIRME